MHLMQYFECNAIQILLCRVNVKNNYKNQEIASSKNATLEDALMQRYAISSVS
jgi:hypothetical protein